MHIISFKSSDTAIFDKYILTDFKRKFKRKKKSSGIPM